MDGHTVKNIFDDTGYLFLYDKFSYHFYISGLFDVVEQEKVISDFLNSYGFDDNFGRVSCDMLGLSNDGTMGVYLQAKDISFMEDLTHIFRVGFVKGTNNTEMVRHGGATLTNGGNSLYLTTADKAWEVNFDTQYKIYKDLTLAVELGYINLDLEKGVWGKTVDNYKDNIFRGAVTLQYTF